MVTSAELNTLTVKQLGALAKELSIAGWHEMRKEELVRNLVAKSRSKIGNETIKKLSGKLRSQPKKNDSPSAAKNPEKKDRKDNTAPSDKNVGRSQASTKIRTELPMPATSPVFQRQSDPKDLSLLSRGKKDDRLVLLVRDPYWLQAYWQLSSKTFERAKVAMGHFWYTASPVIRLFRIESDGSAHPRRQFLRDVVIHGGVNNWYLDVNDPPASFQAELGYLSREKKFFPVASSNTVQTPQQQIVDDFERLDGNWRGVADDLGRIYKLSGGDSGNSELRQVFEEQLKRPMSAPLLSRYRMSQQSKGLEKTQRNFQFEIDADVIIHGKTDPSVQITIRNEPIKVAANGSFAIQLALPEKRHVFPIEAEGSDGVEVQRVVLTLERNTRVLETLFQEPVEDD